MSSVNVRGQHANQKLLKQFFEMLPLDRIFLSNWVIPTVLMIPIYHWASICVFCSFQSVTGKWWYLVKCLFFFSFLFNEHFKYIILLHLCQKIAQTPSLEIKQICSILSEQQAVYALLNRKALTNLILYTSVLSRSVYVLTTLGKIWVLLHNELWFSTLLFYPGGWLYGMGCFCRWYRKSYIAAAAPTEQHFAKWHSTNHV